MTQTDEVNMALAMDTTSVNEFKFVDNTKYSQEIIDGARAVYNPDKLESLKTQQDLTEFYAEGKSQILAQWHADQALNVHTDMFRVVFQINVGEILNTIEPTFKKKADYTAWIKDNFEDKHIRYLSKQDNLRTWVILPGTTLRPARTGCWHWKICGRSRKKGSVKPYSIIIPCPI